MKYVFLMIAILLEVVGTNAMKLSEGFTKLTASVVTALAYAGAFYFLSLCLKTIPLSTAYAMWSGLGIVLTALAAVFLFKQIPDAAALIGMAFIIVGILIIH